MGPLNDENELQGDEKNKNENEKSLLSLKMYNIINFKTIRYKLTASRNNIHSIINYKLMRTVSILWQPKDFEGKTANSKKIQREKGQELCSKNISIFI